MKNTVNLIFCLLMVSCASQQIIMQDSPVPEHIDFVRDKITSLMESGTEDELLHAAILLSREINRQRIGGAEAKAFFTELLDSYRGKASSDDSLRLRNYNILLSHARQSLGDSFPSDHEPLPVVSLGEDFLVLAEKMRVEDNRPLALHYISRSVQLLGRSWFIDRGISLDILLWYISLAREYNNAELLEFMLDTTERNYPLDAEMLALFDDHRVYIAQGWQASVAIGASVTIWVDMGIRFENSVGLPERSIGTGFYIAPGGYIMTNYHVIASEVDPEYEGRSELFIRPGNNPELRISAEVIGYDRVFDIALIKAATESNEVLSFSFSETLLAGSPLYVVGSPGGLANSVTSGIISAGGRRFLQLGDFLQVDVPINPGNSGGPMFDAKGSLVGVVFAGIEQFEGVNFAIPSSWIQYFFPQLFEEGEVEHPWFGLALRESREGLVVVYVVPGSPAEEAGFQEDEIITAIDGRRISLIPEVQSILLSEKIGRLYDLSVKSDREFHRLVYSDVRPYSPLEEILGDKLANVWLPPLFGMKVAILEEEVNTYSITEVFPGSIADESGLSENDSFQLLNWFVDQEARVAVIQIIIQKRRAGYLSDALQLASYIELNSFL